MSKASEYATGGDQPAGFEVGPYPKSLAFGADAAKDGGLVLSSYSEWIEVAPEHVPAFIAWLRDTFEEAQ